MDNEAPNIRAEECRGRSLDEQWPVHRAAMRPEGLRYRRKDMYEDRGHSEDEQRRGDTSITRCIAAALIHCGKVLLVERLPIGRSTLPYGTTYPGGISRARNLRKTPCAVRPTRNWESRLSFSSCSARSMIWSNPPRSSSAPSHRGGANQLTPLSKNTPGSPGSHRTHCLTP